MSETPVVLPMRSVAGLTASIKLGLRTWKLVAAVAPKLTAVAPLKWEPTILTVEPPTMGPELGMTLAMTPAAGVIGALAISTGGGPVHVPEITSVPSVTFRLPAGSIDTVVVAAPEAADVKAPAVPLSENGCVAPTGNGSGSVTLPLNVTLSLAGVAPVASSVVVKTTASVLPAAAEIKVFDTKVVFRARPVTEKLLPAGTGFGEMAATTDAMIGVSPVGCGR